MTLDYFIYSGAGNTFALVDNRKETFPSIPISKLCNELNVDGLILLEESHSVDFRMRIFNRDGSEAEMCGNGLRCYIKFLKKLGIQQAKYQIETLGGTQLAWTQGDEVFVQMPTPHHIRWDVLVNTGKKNYQLHQLTVGVPHAIVFVDDIETVEINSEGNLLRHHPFFAPEGTNVTFVSLSSDKSITIRTYERGVERETLACGTGAVAAALASAKLEAFRSAVTVSVRSGKQLKISYTPSWDKVTMQGPAEYISRGVL